MNMQQIMKTYDCIFGMGGKKIYHKEKKGKKVKANKQSTKQPKIRKNMKELYVLFLSMSFLFTNSVHCSYLSFATVFFEIFSKIMFTKFSIFFFFLDNSPFRSRLANNLITKQLRTVAT